MAFKKPVPRERTIVQGTWSDLMDIWHASFDDDGGSQTEVRVNLQNVRDVSGLLVSALLRIYEQNDCVIKELKILNARFEEMAGTNIHEDDIEA